MGTLTYGLEDRRVEIEDVTLAHLMVAIVATLTSDDSVLLWVHPDRLDGADRVQLLPSTPMRFSFDGPEPSSLDPRTVARLAVRLADPAGFTIPEHSTPR
ncbi:DUF7882 family protein [Microbacterium azadirachtae]|uniref:DUF7882 family protein n=1 Tax=Microbacterium azadirachtae TaxID=582680 RepID=UPI000883D3AA|nr:hypothetical protein [Microbacterium azadirachtae]SDM07258.1 hypothetical protein SAMN04488593_2564 [Microbacterium azadirachtae]SEG32287.1 hypothetical protein SAMN04488594_2550 [Microbacterium azadirachtae]SEG35479.1 hypothetical protein SAMN04488592_2561 [Microbacterium azadirachtae]